MPCENGTLSKKVQRLHKASNSDFDKRVNIKVLSLQNSGGGEIVVLVLDSENSGSQGPPAPLLI